MVRLAFVFIFAILIVTLALCGFISFRSKKSIGKSVCYFCLSLIPPILGNMIIISATTQPFALVGCYIYYIGMDLIMFSLIRFTYRYCPINHSQQYKMSRLPLIFFILLCIDVIQMLLNPIFGHAFMLQETEAYGAPYFLMVPLLGQTYHRIACYGALAMVMLIFFTMSIKVPRIYRERYTVILISMIIGTLWQTVYIFSRTPIDRSMIGFAIFGILIFFFSMYYRPLRLLDRMLADIVSDVKEAVFLYGPEGKCIWVNAPGMKLTGTRDDNFEKAGEVLDNLFGYVTEFPENIETELTIKNENDPYYYLFNRGSFYDNNDKVFGSYVRIRDITSDKRRMEKEFFATNHDSLTGLYTREYTLKKITDKLNQEGLKDYYIASITISDFKMFNDVFGREFGDYALIQVAKWMQQYSVEGCIYGRMSGDTFGSCLPKQLFIREKLEEDLSNFKIRRGNSNHNLVIHIGFYSVEEDDRDVSIMFDRSLLALDSIRNNYKRHVAFFDKDLRDKMMWNQQLSSQLGTAIEENQVFPYLQPIVDREDNIVGAEALARWIHPTHGFMPPGDFIPLFEENGMILDLDRHIWASACKILAKWKTKYPDLFISINVSPRDFYISDVLSDIRTLVRQYEIEPQNLRIEVTETSMMSDMDEKILVLKDFQKLGFIIEMDDFGSGYSSLNTLKDIPVDVLKIDMKFLGKSSNPEKADIIVKNVITLSKDLGIVSLTEGVETEEQVNMLKNAGCQLFQGYYFSKPVPLSDFEKMLT